MMKKTKRGAAGARAHVRHPVERSAVSKLRLRAWLHLLFAVQDIERRLRQHLSDEFSETLARLDVLAALSRVPAGVTMTELSASLRLTKGNITGLVGRLMRDGLVAREAKDGRSVIVSLSPKGRDLFARMAVAHEGWLDELLGSLTGADLRRLIEVLAKLRVAL
jgi:DNA-binding MarR family transcriptional regulator